MTHPTIIIGAGIVGVATAIWLQRAGHQVILIDREGPAAGASFGNGGVLAAAAIVPVTGPGLLTQVPRLLFDKTQPLFVKWHYLPRLLPWLMKYLAHANQKDTRKIAAALSPMIKEALADHQALAAGTKAEKWLKDSHFLYLYQDKQAFEKERFGWELRAENGYQWQEMTRADLHSFQSELSDRVGFGIQLSAHGYVTSPSDYIQDLCESFIEAGGELRIAEVEEICCKEGIATGVSVKTPQGRQTIDGEKIVLTTGIWSGPLAKQVGVSLPLEAERGYHIDLRQPNFMPKAPMLIAAGQFVITPMEGRIRLAGVLEFGGTTQNPSKAPFDLLLYHLKKTLPDLTWQSQTRWMGFRPVLPDSLPVIGPAPDIKGAYIGGGHHHVGLTGGARTGKWLAQMVQDQPSNDDLHAYRANRFT